MRKCVWVLLAWAIWAAVTCGISLGEIIPKMQEKGFTANIGASFVSKFEKADEPILVMFYPETDTSAPGVIATDQIISKM